MPYKDINIRKAKNKERQRRLRRSGYFKEYQREYQKGYSKKPKQRFREYKRDASRKNKEFAIDMNFFMTLWQKPCYYCGGKIETIGLDRVNNEKGYLEKNIVSCCKICNVMKKTMTKKCFINHCKNIYIKHKPQKLPYLINTMIKQAIKLAIEGGWDSSYDVIGEKGTVVKTINKSMSNSDIFLDPSFWQSLGKSLGWERKQCFSYLGKDDEPIVVIKTGRHECNKYCGTYGGIPLYHQHRFIDHLAEGKDPELFFKELLAN